MSWAVMIYRWCLSTDWFLFTTTSKLKDCGRMNSFELIDVGTGKDIITRPYSAKIKETKRHVVTTLHWPDVVPRHLQHQRKFWVGPIDECIDALHLCWGSGPGA